MGPRLLWDAREGATVGLARRAGVAGLTALGCAGCMRPILTLASAHTSFRASKPVRTLRALAPCVLLHAGGAVILGTLLAGAAALRRPLLAGFVAFVGVAVGMWALDAAVPIVRGPGHPFAVTGPRSLNALIFGLVLAAWMVGRGHGNMQAARGVVEPVPGPDRSTGAVGTEGHGETSPSTHVGPRGVLEIVITPACFGCARARTLAAAIAAGYPSLDVRVVDLSTAGARVPRGLVAVPSYVLNGRIVFIGNPTHAALTAMLAPSACGTVRLAAASLATPTPGPAYGAVEASPTEAP